MGILGRFMSRFSRDIGVDLGTATTLVHVKEGGIVVREPSVVAINIETRRVVSVGAEAKRMLGRTPGHIVAIRPLRDGVIADFDVTEAMLRYFVRKVHNRSWLVHPHVVIGVPSGITEVERRAVEDATREAGAWSAEVIEEPMAAAIGAGMPVAEAVGNMIVDIGGGTTEVAVIALGGMCAQRSIRIAGDEIDEAIVTYMRREHNLYIGEGMAEWAKIEAGSAYPQEQEMTLRLSGRDLVSGLPKGADVTSGEIREAIAEPLAAIVETVKQTLEDTPPELAADIMNRGIVLAGGGALLRGLDQLLSAETSIPVYIAEDPMTCVVLGTAKYLEELGQNIRPTRIDLRRAEGRG